MKTTSGTTHKYYFHSRQSAAGFFRLKTILPMVMGLALWMPVYSQDVTEKKPETAADKSATKITLNLETVISGVVKRNLDVKKAAIDYSDAGSDLERFLGQYDTFSYAKLFNQYRQLSKEDPSVGTTQPYQTGQYGGEAGLQKSFSTGTTVQASVTSLHQDLVMTPVVPYNINIKGYSNTAGVTLSQELLKNAFGINQRRIEKSIAKGSEIKQRAARQAIADTVLVSFSAYWNCVIAEENLKTAQIAYKNTQDIRDLVKRKSAVGMSEPEEQYDWESRVLLTKNSVEGAQVEFTNARLAILRALDLDRNSDVEIVRNLNMDPPDATYEVAIKDALKKRTDLANLRQALEISEMSYASAKNSALPSIKASGGMGYSDYNTSFSKSYDTCNKQWFAAVTISKPLEGTYDDAEIKASKNALAKRRIEVRQLENGIRDEIRVRLDQCNAAYKVYKQTTQASDNAQIYYEFILRKFTQGRYESTYLKLAFDNYILLRTNALKTLVDYNIALLQFDIAKNTVFEKYSIDVDALVSKNSETENVVSNSKNE
jgi:outer membrane protein TolC